MAAWVNPIIKGALDYPETEKERGREGEREANSVTVGEKAMKIITIEETADARVYSEPPFLFSRLLFSLFSFLVFRFARFVEFYASKCLTDWQKKP